MHRDLLLFRDSDLIIEPGAVSKIAEALRTENADLINAAVKQITVSSQFRVEKRQRENAPSELLKCILQLKRGAAAVQSLF
jgi:broad-specificity NMP kinase